jgi:hypothetical protein
MVLVIRTHVRMIGRAGRPGEMPGWIALNGRLTGTARVGRFDPVLSGRCAGARTGEGNSRPGSGDGTGGESLMKLRGEGIEVRRRPGARAPEAFLWRGRLYAVRSVLGHWKEPRPWWTDRPARVLRGEDVDIVPPAPAGEREPAGCRDTAGPVVAEENEIWRVEAGPGRMAAGGVYDLLREPASPGTTGAWRLLRVSD